MGIKLCIILKTYWRGKITQAQTEHLPAALTPVSNHVNYFPELMETPIITVKASETLEGAVP